MAYDPPSSLASFHSRYAPRREAERYVDAALSGRRPSVIFIVGGGLNYIGAALAERFPKALRVSLQPCSDFLGYEEDTPGISWHPSSASGLAAAIGAALSGDRIGGGVAVIEWPPVASRFPAETERIKAELKRALEAASSDSATSSYWAYRWLRNSLRFASSVSRVGSLVPGAAPIVIACAGPSLDDEISGLRRIRAGISLWALASAVPALLSRGLEPDIAVSTDPGFWNGYHVTAAVARAIPIAMPPSSFVPAEAYSGTSIIALNTGMSFERAAIEAAGVSARLADAGGSAAGTALSLALGLTTGPVALAGYDLAARGFDDHVAPYAFDA
ncbi:MAG: DUF115 domain-containing protein, partial [Spirochaetes bacterium]|nr:DUF115 domain-containing protein [Spirochaetota bacterium]